jgi:plasmid stability protein
MTATMHLLRGRAALQAGRSRREEARTALREAVAIEGVPPEAWFWLGEALSGENAPESRAAYEKYIELDPDGPYASRARRAVR